MEIPLQFRLIQPFTPDYDEMVDLRMQVLLDPIGIPRSYINPQKETADLLLGAYLPRELAGCCILTQLDAGTVQLRQMAIAFHLQGKGLGAKLLRQAETLAGGSGYTMLILHARDNVIPFYLKSGYEIFGEPFAEVGIGHHKMRKKLGTDDLSLTVS